MALEVDRYRKVLYFTMLSYDLENRCVYGWYETDGRWEGRWKHFAMILVVVPLHCPVWMAGISFVDQDVDVGTLAEATVGGGSCQWLSNKRPLLPLCDVKTEKSLVHCLLWPSGDLLLAPYARLFP